MECNNFSILQGCSKCKCNLDNTKSISLLDSTSIIDILDELILQCHLFPNNKILLNKSSIDCIGNISIVYTNIVNDNQDRYIKYIYLYIIVNWLKSNISMVYDSINILYLTLCMCIVYYDEPNYRVLRLIESLENITNYIYSHLRIFQEYNNF